MKVPSRCIARTTPNDDLNFPVPLLLLRLVANLIFLLVVLGGQQVRLGLVGIRLVERLLTSRALVLAWIVVDEG